VNYKRLTSVVIEYNNRAYAEGAYAALLAKEGPAFMTVIKLWE